jgi:hypothetical protein
MRLAQRVLEKFHAEFLVLPPLKSRLLPCQAVQRLGDFRKIADEVAIVSRKPQEAAHLCHVDWFNPVSDCAYLLGRW